jgi:hypothetical protein
MDVTVQNRDFMAQNQYLPSLAAALRASNRSQPNTVTEIRYSSPNSTARDHVKPLEPKVNPRTTSFGTLHDFWNPTFELYPFTWRHRLILLN